MSCMIIFFAENPIVFGNIKLITSGYFLVAHHALETIHMIRLISSPANIVIRQDNTTAARTFGSKTSLDTKYHMIEWSHKYLHEQFSNKFEQWMPVWWWCNDEGRVMRKKEIDEKDFSNLFLFLYGNNNRTIIIFLSIDSLTSFVCIQGVYKVYADMIRR